MREFLKILSELEEFDLIQFGRDDIVRSGLVKNYILTRMRLGFGSSV